jgi:hypothetical protein
LKIFKNYFKNIWATIYTFPKTRKPL